MLRTSGTTRRSSSLLSALMIRDLEDAMDAYTAEEYDQDEVDKVYRMGDGVIQKAYKWFEELEEAYHSMRNKEIIILDGIRKAFDPFNVGDSRCVYEFLKQAAPLEGLSRGEALEVFVEELLSPSIQQDLPKPVSSMGEV